MNVLRNRVRLEFDRLENRLVPDGTLIAAAIDGASVSGEPTLEQQSTSVPTPGITVTDEAIFIPVQVGPIQPPDGGVTVPPLSVESGSLEVPSLAASLGFTAGYDDGSVAVSEPSTTSTPVPITVGPVSTTLTAPVPSTPDATLDPATPSATADPELAVGGESILPV